MLKNKSDLDNDKYEAHVITGTEINAAAHEIVDILNAADRHPSPKDVLALLMIGSSVAKEMGIPKNIISEVVEMTMGQAKPEEEGMGFHFMADTPEQAEAMAASLKLSMVGTTTLQKH